jgi:hypothetical protein
MGGVDFFEIGLLIVVFGIGVGGFLYAAYKED